MKIALFNFQLMEFGGFVTYQREIYKMFRNGGHQVEIAYYGAESKAVKALRRDGYKALSFKKDNVSELEAYLNGVDIIFIPYVYKSKVENKFDFLDLMIPFQGKKVFLTIHDPAEDIDGGILRSIIKKADYLGIDLNYIFIRPKVKEYYEQKYGLKKTIYIKHPYTRKADAKKEWEKKDIVISTSRIDFDKHLEYLVAKMGEVKGKVEIYSGWINSRYEYSILNEKYGWNRKGYMGGFRYEDMLKIYSRAKVMVDMSRIANDGGGTQYTFLEAMDFGTVLVGNELWDIKGGEMEVGRHYLTANKENIADRINYLLENETERRKLVDNCKEILEAHDSKKIINEYLEYFYDKQGID